MMRSIEEGASFTSVQLRLWLGFCQTAYLCCDARTVSRQGAPNVCHLFYFQLKVDGLPIKLSSGGFDGGIWKKYCHGPNNLHDCCKRERRHTLLNNIYQIGSKRM